MDLKKAIDDILKNIGQERLKQIYKYAEGLKIGNHRAVTKKKKK